jgi:hypothetical protein
VTSPVGNIFERFDPSNIPMQPQSQAALDSQLLAAVAYLNRLGLYDAADFCHRAVYRTESASPAKK